MDVGRGTHTIVYVRVAAAVESIMIILSLVSFLLFWYCEIGETQLTVEVRRYNQSSSSLFFSLLEGDYTVVSTFTDPQGFSSPLAWFMIPYANIPSDGVSGILHYPTLSDACSEELTVDPPPPLLDVTNATWFAVVDNYPVCIPEKVSVLRNAGYQLIISYSYHNHYRHVGVHHGEDVAITEFPIAVVTEEYVDYLVTLNATSVNSNSLLVVFVSADPTAQVWVQVAIVTFLTVLSLLLPVTVCICGAICFHFSMKYGNCALCTFIKCCFCKCRRRTGRYEVHELQHRELGGRGESGREGGRESYEMTILPQRERVVKEFDPEAETNTACPICLDDFNAGDSVEVLPCDSHHIFHPACIEQWLSAQCVCPVCRNLIR